MQKAFQHVGGEALFVHTPEEIEQADGLVLPGVGAFGDCVRCLAKSGMWDAVIAWAKSGKPFFGICVGYQMLLKQVRRRLGKGAGRLEGVVRRFPSDSGLKVRKSGGTRWRFTSLMPPYCKASAAEISFISSQLLCRAPRSFAHRAGGLSTAGLSPPPSRRPSASPPNSSGKESACRPAVDAQLRRTQFSGRGRFLTLSPYP